MAFLPPILGESKTLEKGGLKIDLHRQTSRLGLSNKNLTGDGYDPHGWRSSFPRITHDMERPLYYQPAVSASLLISGKHGIAVLLDPEKRGLVDPPPSLGDL